MNTTITWHQVGSNDLWLGIEHYPSSQPSQCAVCIVHGFRAWHRWGFLPLVGRSFAEHGFEAYLIALPSSGYGPSGFSAARFAQGSIWVDRQALTITLEHLRSRAAGVVGVGHSRGGLLLLLAHNELDCLALWTPPRRFGYWTPRQRTYWRQQKFLPVGTHPETGEHITLGIEYLEDIEQHDYNADIERAARQCRKPILVLAAEADIVARPSDAAELFALLGSPYRSLEILPRTGHTLDTNHPAQSYSAALTTALERTLAFFRANCRTCGNFADC